MMQDSQVLDGNQARARDDDSDSSSDGASSTASLQKALHDISIMSDREVESVALLREIFPEQSEHELKNLHRERLKKSANKKKRSPLTSKLGQRIWNEMKEENNDLKTPEVVLSDDFLRIPCRITSREAPEISRWQSQLMGQLQQRVLRQHREYQETKEGEATYPLDDEYCYTCALSRDSSGGLGMTLCEEMGMIWVHSLLDQHEVRWFRPPTDIESGGPAIKAGIHPGDWVLGIQGEALLPTTHSHFLRHAVSSIQFAENPVVLHLQRVPFNGMHPLAGTGPSLLDTTMETVDMSFTEESVSSATTTNGHATNAVHPLISAMVSKGLIKNEKEEQKANTSLVQYTERARHWESASSFRIDAKTFELRPNFDSRDLSPPFGGNSTCLGGDVGSVRPYAPSTPMINPVVDRMPIEYIDTGGTDGLEDQGLLGFQPDSPQSPRKPTRMSYPGQRIQQTISQPSDVFIPLMGVRKALCVRIVNTFLEEKWTAYTIWCYDVESGREWYAPVRYLADFQELRSATGPLCRSIYKIPFPSSGWLAFGVNERSEPDSVRNEKCRQLENFLRTLCALVYTDQLHPNVAEIAIHVQSFLGCDIGLSQGKDSYLHLQNQVMNNDPMWGQRLEGSHDAFQMNVRLLLKRSIQRYTYRLFLLNSMNRVIDDFVSKTRAEGPTLKEIEALGAKGRDVLKDRAMRDLRRIQDFLDQIQELILEGCANDFKSISQRQDFYALRKFIDGTNGDAYIEKILREAVREQVEIEIYVPLRSVVSRLLVNGWRHDDMEIHFKMQVSSMAIVVW